MYLLKPNILLKPNVDHYNIDHYNINHYNINHYNINHYNIDHYNINHCNINMVISPDVYLSTSIILETFSTLCLKNTIKNKLWYIPCYCGYAISFYIFPKSLSKYTLSRAYTIWCGFGIILTSFIDKLLYKELLTIKKLIGMFIIIYGIMITK